MPSITLLRLPPRLLQVGSVTTNLGTVSRVLQGGEKSRGEESHLYRARRLRRSHLGPTLLLPSAEPDEARARYPDGRRLRWHRQANL